MNKLFKATPRYHAAIKECETVTARVAKFNQRLKDSKNPVVFKQALTKTTT